MFVRRYVFEGLFPGKDFISACGCEVIDTEVGWALIWKHFTGTGWNSNKTETFDKTKSRRVVVTVMDYVALAIFTTVKVFSVTVLWKTSSYVEENEDVSNYAGWKQSPPGAGGQHWHKLKGSVPPVYSGINSCIFLSCYLLRFWDFCLYLNIM